MKKLIFAILGLCFCCHLPAQNEICMFYDAAGNRIQRKLCCTNCLPPPNTTEREQLQASSLGNLRIMPNPSTGLITLSTEGVPSDAQVIIFDISGAIVLKRQLGDGNFNLSACPSGTYIVSLAYGNAQKTALFEKSN